MRKKLQVFGLAVFVLFSSHALSQAVDAHTVTALVSQPRRCDPVQIANIRIGTQTLVPEVPYTVNGDDWGNHDSFWAQENTNPKKYRRITAKQFYAIPGGHTCGQHL